MSQVLSLADVQSHNTKDDLHFIIGGKVYDATEFVEEHPGGPELLLDVAGKDATEAYKDAGHSEEADDILQDFLIGTLDSGSVSQSTSEPPAVEQLQALKLTEEPATKVLKPDAFQEFELVEKTVVSHNVAIYRFKLPSPESIFGLPIGQHISIGAVLPQPDGTSKEIVRSYTPISGDHQPGFFDLLVKAYPQGNITQHIAGLAIGQSIRVRGPKGNFVYTPNMVRHFGMIAGGSGITPMLQIVRAIMRGRTNGDKIKVDLIFANVNEDDILLKDDLDALNKEDPDVRVHFVLNNPPEGWTGGVGFVTKDMISEWLPKPASDVKILLCGPPPMVSAMKTATESLGYEKARPISKVEDQVFAF